jgi:hypothetical protein
LITSAVRPLPALPAVNAAAPRSAAQLGKRRAFISAPP